ncbi:MAG: glucosamine-6-phosphate deaminase [Candidatus Hadarchaeota archaeon]
MVKIKIVENYGTMSIEGADIAEQIVEKNPDAVLGLATGETFLMFYKELVKRHNKGLDFSKVKTFNLDEYVGIDRGHPESFRRYMYENFLNRVNIKEKNVHIPDGTADDLEKECETYEKAIREAGGIDLQFVGIGANGHIAYNEPSSSFDSRTRVIKLDEDTRKRKERNLNGAKVPKKAITMGIETIMESDKIVMLASGRMKAEAVAKAVEGPTTEEVPASVLQKHEDFTLILDEGAASKLTEMK